LVLDAVALLQQDPSAGTAQTGMPSYAHKLTREDGLLDPLLSSRAVLARWAGVTPEPGAFVLHEGNAVKIHDMRETQLDTRNTPAPGVAVLHEGRAILGT